MPQGQPQDEQITLDEWERRTFERYGVPENLRRSILGQESADGTRLTSPTGVKGRYQVTQDTAKQYGLDRDDQWQQPVAAAKHLRSLYDGVRKRNPGFSDKQAWLGASAEYYFGGDAFDADGNLSAKSRDGYSNPAKYATSIAEKWSAFDRGGTPQVAGATAPARSPAQTRADQLRKQGFNAVEWQDGKTYDLSSGNFIESGQQSKYTPPRQPMQTTADRKFQNDKVIDAMIRNGATREQITEARRRMDAALQSQSPQPTPGRPPKLSADRIRKQEDALYEWAKSTPSVTNEQIVEARRRLSGMSDADFQKTLKTGGQQVPGKPFRRARIEEALRAQFEPTGAVTEAELQAERAPGPVRDFARRLVRPAVEGLEDVRAALSTIPYMTGSEAPPAIAPTQLDPLGAQTATQAVREAERAKKVIAERLPYDPRISETRTYNPLKSGFYRATLPETVSSLAVPVVAGALSGPAAPLTLGAYGAAQNAGQTLQEAKEAGVSDEEAMAAAGIGAAIGTTEAFGIGRILAKAGVARPVLKRLGEIIEEYGQEAGAAWLNNLNAAEFSGYDPSRPTSFFDPSVQGPGFVGALLGGGVQGLDVAGQRISGRSAAQPQPQPLSAPAGGRSSRAERVRAAVGATSPSSIRSDVARQDYAARVEPGVLARNYVRQVEEINRTIQNPEAKQAALDQARAEFQQANRDLRTQQAPTVKPTAEPTTQPQEPTSGTVRPGAEEISPEFRSGARRQALAMMGLSPEQIEAEMAKRTQSPQAEPLARRPRAAEPAETVASQRPSTIDAAAERRRRAVSAVLGSDPEAGAQERGRNESALLEDIAGDIDARRDALVEKLAQTSDRAERNALNADIRALSNRANALRQEARQIAQPAPPAPEQPKPVSITERRRQQRQRLYESSRNIASRAMEQAQQAMDAGDFIEAQAQLAGYQRALRDQARYAPAESPGARTQVSKELIRVGAQINDVKRQAEAQRRLESQPTRGLTAPRPRPLAQSQALTPEQARASSPLLGSVVNPEGGIPQAPEGASGKFGALVRQQAAEATVSPQSRRKDTGLLSPVEYLKRATKREGIRVSDRGEAALLGSKEGGIVGLVNKQSKWTMNDAAVMLDEGGFMLPDGRAFTDPSVTENDVLTFLGAGGKQDRLNTSALDQKLVDEEAEYYARFEEDEAEPTQQRRTPPAPPSPRRPGRRVGIPQPPSRRQSDTGSLEELGDFFGEMARQEAPAPETPSGKIASNIPSQVRATLRSKSDRDIDPRQIGLSHAYDDIADPVKPKFVQGWVHIDDIDIGTPEINAYRVLQADKNLSEQGLRTDVDDPVTVSPRRSVNGRWVAVDGNSRLAALKLSNFDGYLPVTGFVESTANPGETANFYRSNPAGERQAESRAPMQAPAKPLDKTEGGRRPVEQAKRREKEKEEEPPTVVHPNPEIDRKPILATTKDGRVIVENDANKGGVSVVKDRSDEETDYKFSSTQVNLPPEIADKILAFGRRIPDSDLADNGRETEPHITVKYGLHGWDAKFAEEALAGEDPAMVTFGKVSLFENDDFDVVKVDVQSRDLHRLNKRVAESQPVTDTFPDYKPHATIAYVKKGKGKRYVGNTFLEGQTATINSVTFSRRDGERVEIPLTAKSKPKVDWRIPDEAMPELREKERSRDWQPRSLDRSESYADIATNIRFRSSKSATRANVVYGNAQAQYWMRYADRKLFGETAGFNGLNLSASEARRYAAEIRDAKKFWKQTGLRSLFQSKQRRLARQADARLEALAKTLEDLADKHERVIYVKASRSFQGIRGTVYHELTHNAERQFRGNMANWFKRAPHADKIRTELDRLDYRESDYLSEAVAHLLGGQRDKLGLSLSEATEFLDEYFANLTVRRGREAMQAFEPLQTAPEMRPTLRQSKERYGPRPIQERPGGVSSGGRGAGEARGREGSIRPGDRGAGGLGEGRQRSADRAFEADRSRASYPERDKEARVNIPPDVRAKAIADSPYNDEKVSVRSLGLESKFPPQPAKGAKPRDIEVNIEDITLGRDDLSKGRMNQVETALKEGFKPAGRKIDAVKVVPDPSRPGKYVVLDDGNHRIALLKLAGVEGKIPVKAWMAPEAKASEANAQAKAKPIRFEVGKRLNRAEKDEVLKSLGDGYKDLRAPRVEKGIDARGETIVGYEYNPDYMFVSDITGRHVRHYVKLPDGRIAHPTELFANLTKSEIDKYAMEREYAEKQRQSRNRSRDERIVSSADLGAGVTLKGRANASYNAKGRKLEGSYLAQDESGRMVRVDGKDPDDVAYFEEQGFTPVNPGAVQRFLSDEGGSAKLNLGLPQLAAKRGQVSETIGGLQTAAQLGNPRFVIRNILQHLVFAKQERGAARLAAVLDWAISAATGRPRQIAAPGGSDLGAYVRNWQKAIKAYKAGQPLPGSLNADYLTPDANKLDKSVGKLMTWINAIPDAANWQTRFESSLQSIVEAAKKSGRRLDVDDAIDQAWMEANVASLRDKNFVSESMLALKKFFNIASKPITGTDKWGLGDFIVKYAATPGALLRRGLSRSPLGLFDVAKQAATAGPFRRRNTLLALSRVAEGAVTGLGLGAALAAAGVLVGPEEDDRTSKALEREEGVRGYSLNASALLRFLTGESTKMQHGDKLYSIDWLQPWAMNLSAGAALYGLHKKGKLGPGNAAGATGGAIYDSLAKTLDIMGDQSVLKNLGKYIRSARGEEPSEWMLNFAKAVGLDAPSSVVPSLARQTRQVIDPYERDTRAEQPRGVRGFVSEAKNRALAQLPGVSQRFPTRPSLLTGEDRKTALGRMSLSARIAAQFSPANISTYAPEPVAREISRLFNAGERVSVSLPRRRGEKETGRKGYQEPTSALRIRERKFSESFSRMSRRLIGHPDYKSSDDAVKARAINALAAHLRDRTVKKVEELSTGEIIERAADAVARRLERQEEQ